MQCNTDSCCEHITGGVNIDLYGCGSLLAPSLIRVLAKNHVSDLSKPDVLLHKTHNKVFPVLTY